MAAIQCRHGQDDLMKFSTVADHAHSFMTTVYLFADDSFQQDNSTHHKAKIITNWFPEHASKFTALKCPPQSSDLSPTEQLWGAVESKLHKMDIQLTNL